jgi:predicted RNase H-like HicB family nuclease
MKYVVPAIFTPEGEKYNVEAPDLPGCFTFGDSLFDAINMARNAIEMWLCDAEDKNETIPAISEDLEAAPGSFISFIDADTDDYRREYFNRAVKKTLSIPEWLNSKAEKAGINFSQTLQKALKNELGLE